MAVWVFEMKKINGKERAMRDEKDGREADWKKRKTDHCTNETKDKASLYREPSPSHQGPLPRPFLVLIKELIDLIGPPNESSKTEVFLLTF
jgi:hypothetical protein